MLRTFFASILLLVLLNSCIEDSFNSVSGFKPVYMATDSLYKFSSAAPRITLNPGKIYAYGNYIFQNDINAGIHVIDNSDTKNPRKVAFYAIPYSTEISIKENNLYTNNGNDLLVINITSVQNPVLINRLKGAFPFVNQYYPETATSKAKFECPDPSKGTIVEWQTTTFSETPKCRTK